VEFLGEMRLPVRETITDDWYVIRDQLFLDADERFAMYKAIRWRLRRRDERPGDIAS
jgi:hypothetical protein